ncbi:Bis(5'-nucleosyl)-tetraphosphatase (Asymmetrical) [hydrothermal vent metagenome]|uniref:Bis(5'-nucleosyl)-tetraphosphatase (Asymmetrical) n=1 Tax=hydrothermal vent metagenome TaxID=652676 RepID=A0A3B0TQC9_9ZZZZ
MYKVFFKDKVLIVAHEKEILAKGSDKQLVKINEDGEIIRSVNHFLKSGQKEVVLVTGDIKGTWAGFKQNFKVIKAAGGFVLNKGRFLFIYRWGKWDLPKGKIDKGESPEEAAVREVEEECGVSDLRITRELPSTWHIYQSPYPGSKGEWVLKKTVWFEMAYNGGERLTPQTEEGIVEARWLNPGDIAEVLGNTYPNLESIIRLYC